MTRTPVCIYRQLVAREYPWFLEAYDGFPENIMRSDAVRAWFCVPFQNLPVTESAHGAGRFTRCQRKTVLHWSSHCPVHARA